MMNEIAGTITSAIDGLKAQPLALALILMNLLFIGFTGFLAYRINLAHEQERNARNQFIGKLLDQCMRKPDAQ